MEKIEAGAAHAEAIGGAVWRITFPWGTEDRIGGNAAAVRRYMRQELDRRQRQRRQGGPGGPGAVSRW